MKTIEFRELGAPAEVLQMVELPLPALEAGQVTVRLTARAIRPSDTLNVRGEYARPPPLPSVPGNDGAGVVAALGAGVTDFAVGDRVMLMLGATRGTGTWKEAVNVPAAMVVKTPAALSDAQAGAAWVNYLSAWVMAIEMLQLKTGDTLLQTAAGSQLGRAMIELAKLKGFKLINVVRRREQVAELQALGAEQVICTGDQSLPDAVKTLTSGKGVKYAIDAVGAATAGQVVESLATGGVVVLFGALDNTAPMTVQPGMVLFKELQIRGFWLTRWLASQGPRHRAVVDELLGHFERGEFKPAIDSTYPFEKFVDAVTRAESSGRQGSVVLTS